MHVGLHNFLCCFDQWKSIDSKILEEYLKNSNIEDGIMWCIGELLRLMRLICKRYYTIQFVRYWWKERINSFQSMNLFQDKDGSFQAKSKLEINGSFYTKVERVDLFHIKMAWNKLPLHIYVKEATKPFTKNSYKIIFGILMTCEDPRNPKKFQKKRFQLGRMFFGLNG